MLAKIKHYIFAWKYRRAVREAKKLAGLFDMKYYVISLNGDIKVIPKQIIKELVRRKRFRKGVTVDDIEKKALFITK